MENVEGKAKSFFATEITEVSENGNVKALSRVKALHPNHCLAESCFPLCTL
jgi:hypothetical protein